MGREVFTLDDAEKLGQTIVTWCVGCRRKRYYDPRDFIRLFGPVECHRIERRLRCQRCGTGDMMRSDIKILSAADRQSIRMTRIKEIRTVRRVIWEDE
ncbi:hypothetical protein [Aliihoeflea sp. PC F10.4]